MPIFSSVRRTGKADSSTSRIISSFSEAGYLMRHPPYPLGDLLQRAGFAAMRILSSAEKCRRVARPMFFTTCVAGSFSGADFCLIFAP
jgi:DNA-binding IclR family transcriptional regulator